jgi:hypothetical protein
VTYEEFKTWTQQRQSLALNGHSPEGLERIAETQRPRVRSEELRARTGETLRQMFAAKRAAGIGRSEQHQENHRRAVSGPRAPEHRERIAEANRAKAQDPAIRLKLKLANGHKIQTPNGVFDTKGDCARQIAQDLKIGICTASKLLRKWCKEHPELYYTLEENN